MHPILLCKALLLYKSTLLIPTIIHEVCKAGIIIFSTWLWQQEGLSGNVTEVSLEDTGKQRKKKSVAEKGGRLPKPVTSKHWESGTRGHVEWGYYTWARGGRNVKGLRCPGRLGLKDSWQLLRKLLPLMPKSRKMRTKTNQVATVCQVFFYNICTGVIVTTNPCKINVINPFSTDEKTATQKSGIVWPRLRATNWRRWH